MKRFDRGSVLHCPGCPIRAVPNEGTRSTRLRAEAASCQLTANQLPRQLHKLLPAMRGAYDRPRWQPVGVPKELSRVARPGQSLSGHLARPSAATRQPPESGRSRQSNSAPCVHSLLGGGRLPPGRAPVVGGPRAVASRSLASRAKVGNCFLIGNVGSIFLP